MDTWLADEQRADAEEMRKRGTGTLSPMGDPEWSRFLGVIRDMGQSHGVRSVTAYVRLGKRGSPGSFREFERHRNGN